MATRPRKRKAKAKARRQRARKTSPRARKKTAKRKAAKRARPRPRKAKRTVAKAARRRSRARKPPRAAAPATMRALEPEATAATENLERAVEEALRERGYDPPDGTVLAVLTAIATGYRQGPAHPPSWLHVDVDGPIAEGIVERFATGDRAHDIDRSTHRPQVRATVGMNLDQLPGPPTGTAERDVLTSFCLGSWDPNLDTNAERNGIASFVVPWYLAGRA